MRPRFVERPLYVKGEMLGRLLVRPFQTFASREASGGILLLVMAVAGMIWMNSPWGWFYERLWHVPLGAEAGSRLFERSLHFWINDGLMTIFFFVVGLEIKRELLVGELASFRQAALPVSAAVGGMIVPAFIYHLFNGQGPTAMGWGIPMATDIAFMLGALTVLRSRIPHSVTVFLVALAVADDLGAVVVISTFYAADISEYYIAMSCIFMVVLVAINIMGFRRPLPYIVVGCILWLMVSLSGVHSTLAGVLVAMTIPARSRFDTDTFLQEAKAALNEFDCAGSCGYSMYWNEDHQAAVHALENMCHHVEPPLQRIENWLHPWVAFLIIPVFGLANAGVHIEWSKMGEMLTGPLALGIVLGLFLGKQIGILGATWLAIKFRLGVMPAGASIGHIYGGAVLCGIGFTMSLFICNLAFYGSPFIDTAKIAIFVGSLLSFIVGMAILYLSSSKDAAPRAEHPEKVPA
ncbi:MAG: Na+/H+ antiporter NhaA [Deltaproteobacteria bacterium]